MYSAALNVCLKIATIIDTFVQSEDWHKFMRLRIKNGKWYDTESAVYVTDKLRYTRRGHWIYHRIAEGEVVDEAEAIRVMLSHGNAFENCTGYRKLPQEVRDRLESSLDNDYPLADEV